MRKLLLLASFLFLCSLSFAQTAEETIDWLNVKKDDFYLGNSYSNVVANGYKTRYLLMTTKNIKLSDVNDAWTDGDWASIKEIKTESGGVKIVFNFNYEGAPSFIFVAINNAELKEKVFKAFKHMATLKGAKMIDHDLF